MQTLNSAFDIGRLNKLYREKPTLLQELGVIRNSEDLIFIPQSPSTFDLRSIHTGQAALFNNDKLSLDLWTTKSFDFRVKEWTHSIALHNNKGQAENIAVTVENNRVILTDGSSTLQLPLFTDEYPNGLKVSKNIVGVTRFSIHPSRSNWTTGPMVWL